MLGFNGRKTAYKSYTWAKNYDWTVEPNPLLNSHWWTNSILFRAKTLSSLHMKNTKYMGSKNSFSLHLYIICTNFSNNSLSFTCFRSFYFVQNCLLVLIVNYSCLKIWISFICYQKNRFGCYGSSKSQA